MSVHYKFKSSLDFDTITFDGLHISVNDFRKAVIQQKRLGKTNDFELQITNAQTKEEYENDSDLIPKNTSLIISRIPQTSKKSRDTQNQNAPATICHVPKFDNNNLDLSQMNASEEDKIQAMMAQSTVDYDPRGYQKIRCPGQTGEVPPTYRCYKCHQTGHWIKNCPLPHSSSKKSEIRRNTGIPKSFLQEKGIEKESVTEEIVILDKQAEVPDELVCSICKDIFRDAVMIPCCGSSFCDDCVRTALLESEENECPDCKEKGTSPGSLIPNRFLRSSVNTFKNETGYERKRKNNGTQETLLMTENIPEPVIENSTKVESPEKNSPIENKTNQNVDIEQTLPKQSPEKDIEITQKEDHKLKDEKVKAEVKEEFSSKDIVEPGSPKRHVEVVLPQREIVQNSEIQVRSDEGFKQGNQATFPNYGTSVSEMSHRSGNVESYPVRTDTFMRHSKPGQGLPPPHMNYCNNYGNRTDRYYYPREPFNINTAPYPFMQNNRCRQMTPHSNIQPYYQGMSGAIEPGIIEDPLEAFNRIMKEKEKRKELKRMASDRHRSSAVKRTTRDASPITEKRVRHRASPINERRNRSPLRQDKPVRSSERDKNLRVHRSHYSSNKRSFSRSNSPPQRRYSKSPRRRSRSRSHPRSHSREYDTLRHDGRSSKHALQQSHKGDHEKEFSRFTKKTSGRFSETRNISDIVPKENRRHNSKLRENGNSFFDNYSKSSRKMYVENENLQENRDTLYEFDEKRGKAPVCKSDEGNKREHRKVHENDGDRERQHSYLESELPKQESERKTKERKKKKDKDEKSEKKSKKEKKDKKKRERNKEDVKKHSQHNKPRKESESTLNPKVNEETSSLICTSRIDAFKSSNEESLDDRTETFTPDININRNLESDKIEGQNLYENRLDEENSVFKGEKSPKSQQNADNNCSGLNTPTSFVDTTPENYAGKWDNFDFSVPNSEDIKEENERDCDYDRHMFQNYPSAIRNDQIESIKHLSKKKESSSRSQQHDEGRSKNERSESNTRVNSRRPSPVPSEAMSSSTNNSNAGKNSQSKKRRKKSKHKKEKQYYKRSSSADSSRHSRKSASKHKKSRSEKKKKTKRNESR